MWVHAYIKRRKTKREEDTSKKEEEIPIMGERNPHSAKEALMKRERTGELLLRNPTTWSSVAHMDYNEPPATATSLREPEHGLLHNDPLTMHPCVLSQKSFQPLQMGRFKHTTFHKGSVMPIQLSSVGFSGVNMQLVLN